MYWREKTSWLLEKLISRKIWVKTTSIANKDIGVCGSDLHFYTHGAIGPFVVRKPMVLGHEAAGRVIEVGKNVTNLEVGGRGGGLHKK